MRKNSMGEKKMQDRLFSDRQLIKLMIPLVIEQGLTILVGMCDGVMVSAVSEAAISGVSLVDMINAVILVLFAALATGGAVVTSQLLGARRTADARRSAGQLVSLTFAMGCLMMTLCLIFARGLLKLFFGSIADDVMAAGLIYLRITALSFPFIALYNAGAAIFRSVGNSKVSMQVSLWMNGINVAGNALCVFVLKMGVAGVAVPTLVSRAVAAVMILTMASRKGQELTLDASSLYPIDRQVMGKILRIGIPSACENSFFQFGRLLVVSMIALFGTTQTSANAVANNLDSVGTVVGQAMGLAMVTVVGQSVGAGDKEQATFYLKKVMKWSIVALGAVNLMIILFLNPLIGLYRSLTPQTVELTRTLVLIHSTAVIFMWAFSFVLPNAFRAANDVQFTMWVGMGSMLVFRVGVSWILCVHLGWGAVGVWIAMILDWVCRISFFLPRALTGKWLSKI